jgi:hypothetical protein
MLFSDRRAACFPSIFRFACWRQNPKPDKTFFFLSDRICTTPSRNFPAQQ